METGKLNSSNGSLFIPSQAHGFFEQRQKHDKIKKE